MGSRYLLITLIISLFFTGANLWSTEISINIGDGQQTTYWYPLNFWYRTSVSQVIYMSSEFENNFGFITEIEYNNNFSTNLQNTPIILWMGTTTQSHLSNGWIPTSQMTMVFDGVLSFPSGNNMISISLDEPFYYGSDNLVIMALRPMDTSWHSSLDQFYYTVTNEYPNRARNFASDSQVIDPDLISYPGTTHSWVPNTVFHMTIQELDDDLAALSIEGETVASVGETVDYTVSIINYGTNQQNDYTVRLIKEGNVEIQSIPGLSIENGETINYDFTWTPENAGTTYLWGEVILDGDENPANNSTPNLGVTVTPQFQFYHQVGSDQTSENSLPLNFWRGSSLSQVIYMEDDFNNEKGVISSIQYFNNFVEAIPDKPVRIWMANTLETDITDFWIPFNEFSLVFDGTISFPAGQNDIFINLDNEFHYFYGNLVIMVQRPYEDQTYNSSNHFYYTETPDYPGRSRYAVSNFSDINPGNYPGWANIHDRTPNTGIFFSEELDIQYDLMAVSLVGPLTLEQDTESVFLFSVRNTGPNPQDSFDIHLKEGENILSTVTITTNLEPFAEITFEIPWTPTVSGLYTVYAEVSSDYDEVDNNNTTSTKNVYVVPADLYPVTIGESDQLTNVIPVFYTNRASLSQSIFLEEEFNYLRGTISSIAFFNNFATPLAGMPIRVWLANTNMHNLSGGWVPYDLFEEVFDGHIDFPGGPNPIVIEFDNDFEYTHANLAVMVQSPLQMQTYSGQFFYYLETQGQGFRSRMAQSSINDLDPIGLPFGSFSMVEGIPFTDFYFSEVSSLENDLSAISISGQNYINVGEPAIFDVVIRNTGTMTQNEFDVILRATPDTELASVNVQQEIEYLEEITVPVEWTPSTEGTFNIFAEVFLENDEMEDNNTTETMPVQVIPGGLSLITVGNLASNTSANTLPLNFWWRNSISQTLYYQDELEIGGALIAITYYNNFNSDLSNMPVQLWAAVTDINDFGGGWIEYDSFEQIFDGFVDFPQGQNEITIVLDEPFFYSSNDGHLVIMAHRPYEDYYSSLDRFFYTETPNQPERSIAFQSDSIVIDPENPPEGFAFDRVANTTLHFNTGGIGSLNGLVHDENNIPVENALVSITDTTYDTFTDNTGYFDFPFIFEGTYNLTVEKFEYYLASQEITIIDQETLSLDITLESLPLIEVSGEVVTSDDHSNLIDGAEISVTGYSDYYAVTDDQGAFLIGDVYGDQSYFITVTYPGYETYESEFSTTGVNLDLGTIIVNEIAYPPTNLHAELSPDGYVELTWDHPEPDNIRLTSERSPRNMQLRQLSTVDPEPLVLRERILELFTVFRFLEGNEENESTWSEIATVDVQENTYIDQEIASLPNGNYKYAVKAVYTNNVLSPAIISNTVEFFMNITITVSLSTNSGDSPTGAIVNLANTNMNPEHQYSSISPASGIVIFQNIWKGFYNLEVTLLGFDNHVEENIDLTQENTVHPVELIEQILPVQNLTYDIENNNISLSWDHPYSEQDERYSEPLDFHVFNSSQNKSKISIPRLLTGFNVYRTHNNETIIIAENISDLTLTDTDLPDGTYIYAVEALYVTGSATVETDEIFLAFTHPNDSQRFITSLKENFPNPFNPYTHISFTLADKSLVKIDILNIKGQNILTLTNKEYDRGFHTIKWNGLSASGESVGSGIYFYKMTTDNYQAINKMLLLK